MRAGVREEGLKRKEREGGRSLHGRRSSPSSFFFRSPIALSFCKIAHRTLPLIDLRDDEGTEATMVRPLVPATDRAEGAARENEAAAGMVA